jgi:hypothetical protein
VEAGLAGTPSSVVGVLGVIMRALVAEILSGSGEADQSARWPPLSRHSENGTDL